MAATTQTRPRASARSGHDRTGSGWLDGSGWQFVLLQRNGVPRPEQPEPAGA